MRDASPKAISGRTSYLRVRLAFHLYPQLISQLFNVEEFGPPRSFTSASTWPWVAHSVSGLVHATTGLLDPRPIQTRFRFGFGRQALTSPHTANSPDHSSIGTPSRYRDESRQHASTACRHTVSVSISLPSRGAFHLSLTVLVHYRSLEVFSLRQWSDWFPTQETFRVVLESSDRRLIAFAYRAITVYGGPFQAPSANDQFCNSVMDRQVHRHASQHPFRNDCRLSRGKGLGYSRFARHYSGNDFCSSRY